MQPTTEDELMPWWAVDDGFNHGRKAVLVYEALGEETEAAAADAVPLPPLEDPAAMQRALLDARREIARLRVRVSKHAAFHLWMAAGLDSAEHLLDGRVRLSNMRAMARMTRTEDRELFTAAVEALMGAGLLEAGRDAGEVVMHDWEQCNPTRAQVLAKRERDLARKRGKPLDSPVAPDSARNPRGIAEDSAASRSVPLPLPLSLTRTVAQARAGARDVDVGNGEDKDRVAIIAALRRYPVFADFDVDRAADGILVHQCTAPVPVERLVGAVGDAAGAIGLRLAKRGAVVSDDERLETLRVFCAAVAGGRRQNRPAPARGAPQDAPAGIDRHIPLRDTRPLPHEAPAAQQSGPPASAARAADALRAAARLARSATAKGFV